MSSWQTSISSSLVRKASLMRRVQEPLAGEELDPQNCERGDSRKRWSEPVAFGATVLGLESAHCGPHCREETARCSRRTLATLANKRVLEHRIAAAGVGVQVSRGIFLVMTSRGRRRHLPRAPRLTEQGRVRSRRDGQPDHNCNSPEHVTLANLRRKRPARAKQRNCEDLAAGRQVSWTDCRDVGN
jgi:hypothetical protein